VKNISLGRVQTDIFFVILNSIISLNTPKHRWKLPKCRLHYKNFAGNHTFTNHLYGSYESGRWWEVKTKRIL